MQLGVLEYLISVDNSKLKKGLKDSEQQVKQAGEKDSKSLSKWAVAKGQAIEKLAEKAAKSSLNFIKNSVTETMTFDKNMSQVAATMGKTVQQMDREMHTAVINGKEWTGNLSQFARKMGAETAFSAQEASQALNYMALAGYDADTSMKMLPQVLNLAAAGNFDLARASDMVTDAQSALGLTIEGTETLIDQMARTSSKTNTSVEQLGEAILTVGGTAKIMGEDTEMLNATLGILADNGIKGSEGGTALRNVLLSLSAPTDKAANQLKKLGVQIFDSEGNMRSMEDIMLDMGDAMKDMSSEERTSIISDIFNKRDLKAVEALLGTNKERWESLLTTISDSKDAAKQMAETQLDNLAGDVTIFKSALGEARIAITERLTPSLRKFVKLGTTLLNNFTEAWKKKGFKGVVEETKKTLEVFKKGTAKWLKLENPDDATWWDVGVALGKKLKDGIKNSLGKVKNSLAKWLGLTNASGQVTGGWADIGKKLIEKIGSGVGKAGDFLMQLILGDEYSNGSTKAKSTWKDVGSKLVTWIGEAFKEGGVINELLKTGGEKVSVIVSAIGEGIKQLAVWLSRNSDVIADVLIAIANAFTSAAGPIVDAIIKIITNPDIQAAIWEIIETALEMLWKLLKEGPTAMKAGLAGYLGLKGISAAGGVTPALTKLATFLSTPAGAGLAGFGASVIAPMLVTKLLQGDDYNYKDEYEEGRISNSQAEKLYEMTQGLYSVLNAHQGTSEEEVNAATKGMKSVLETFMKQTYSPKELFKMFELSSGGNLLFDMLMDDKSSAGTLYAMIANKFGENMNQWGLSKEDMQRWIENSGYDFKYGNPSVEAAMAIAQEQYQNMLAAGNLFNYESLADLSTAFGLHFDKYFANLNPKLSDDAQARIQQAVNGMEITVPIVPKIVGGSVYGEGNEVNPVNWFGTAKGNWRVPYDNYPALLHRDEIVLNKSQARQLRDGYSDAGISGDALAAAVERAMSRVYVMMSGEKVGDLTTRRVKKNLNASSYSRMRALGG